MISGNYTGSERETAGFDTGSKGQIFSSVEFLGIVRVPYVKKVCMGQWISRKDYQIKFIFIVMNSLIYILAFSRVQRLSITNE